ncbi:hypothetical protein M408DRAFT_237225 [Serendipita vermifera MAFF 305830]|uniref:Uncharacterized protein n=1 Tax=Serendipita vermifera MAFF 305830 TaxID=933852 RepID=A0A0C3BJR4_SERVB|nr:hypothetical protein M408DRAFT_237225 [Serendipita vermifera MAFF 305830]
MLWQHYHFSTFYSLRAHIPPLQPAHPSQRRRPLPFFLSFSNFLQFWLASSLFIEELSSIPTVDTSPSRPQLSSNLPQFFTRSSWLEVNLR